MQREMRMVVELAVLFASAGKGVLAIYGALTFNRTMEKVRFLSNSVKPIYTLQC